MLRDMLRLEGHQIGRKYVSTLIRKLDIQAIVSARRTQVDFCSGEEFGKAAMGEQLAGPAVGLSRQAKQKVLQIDEGIVGAIPLGIFGSRGE